MAAKRGFGSLIREAREARGWTQQELAERLSTSPSTISNLEREQHPPTVPDQVNALVIALGLSPEKLFIAMGVMLTPPAAARLSRPLVEVLLALPPEEWPVIERTAHGLLALRALEARDRQPSSLVNGGTRR